MLRTLLSFNGARELFLAVVFVGGSFFEGAYRVLPASRSPSVQHPTKKKRKKKKKNPQKKDWKGGRRENRRKFFDYRSIHIGSLSVP